MIRLPDCLRAARLLLILIGMTANFALTCAAQTSGASMSSAPASRILSPPNSYSFPTQKYFYSVQWHLLNAGISTVQMQRSGPGVRVTATADSAGVPDKFFRIHDIFNADLDPHTYCTLLVSKHNEEGPRRREVRILLNYGRSKSEVDSKDAKTSESKHTEFDIPPCVTDVVSGFFYVASLPLAPGFSHTFPVNDNGKTTDVRIEAEAREKVKVSSGEFETVRVMAMPLSGPMKGKGVLWVWFSDGGHVPVQMKSKLGFATLTFQLQRIEPPTGGH
jgi:Protein of unknown function (DUF3108)